jgi:alkyl hydroperoxide reductase subunit AhpF
MLTFLGENDRRAVSHILADLQRPVHLLLFTAAFDDTYSHLVYSLLNSLESLDARLHLEVHDQLGDITLALRLRLCGLPAILVSRAANSEANIRFYGLPSGYTFVTLLEAVLLVSGAPGIQLRAETREFLTSLRVPVHIQIFITADDATCAATAVLVHAFADAYPALVVDTIEIRAFPKLAERYCVTQTPTVVIDEQAVIPGPVDEAELMRQLRRMTAANSQRTLQ